MLQLYAFLLITFLLQTAAPCHAQHMNEPESPCAKVLVTSDLVSCLSQARTTSDTEMNSLYRNLRKKLGASDANRLIEAQRLWVKYREANCSAERDLYGGGTAAFPAYLGCLEAMTRARSRELRITYAVRLK